MADKKLRLIDERHKMAKIPDKILVEKTLSGDLYMTFEGNTESYTFQITEKSAVELLDAMNQAVTYGESIQ